MMILSLSLISMMGEVLNPYTFHHFVGGASVFSIYILPAVFIYGIGVSISVEVLCVKMRVNKAAELISSFFLHGLFGYAYGYILQSSMFSFYGSIAAIFFFLMDKLIFWLYIKKKLFVSFLVTTPVVLFGLFGAYLFVVTPPLPPFTEEDAVAFATSGTGTIIDDFPDQAGKIETFIEGYKVTRETQVKAIEDGRYKVIFIENWDNGSEVGERWIGYLVERGSLAADGGGGEDPPY
jgi:hypothetical protein